MIDLTRQLAEARAEIAATIQWRYEMAKKLADTEQQLAEARAANERLRETYKRVSSVHSDRASRMDDLQQQLAEARAVNEAAALDAIDETTMERDMARAALSEACDLLAIARLGDSPPLREQADVIRKRGGL